MRACQCSFCRAHAGLTASDPPGSLAFVASAPDKLHRYRFGSRTTDFLLCRECGINLGARSETPNGVFGVVNIRALRPMPAELPPAQPIDYAQESVAAKLERREARWTPLLPESL